MTPVSADTAADLLWYECQPVTFLSALIQLCFIQLI